MHQGRLRIYRPQSARSGPAGVANARHSNSLRVPDAVIYEAAPRHGAPVDSVDGEFPKATRAAAMFFEP